MRQIIYKKGLPLQENNHDMHLFDYQETPRQLLTPEIVNMLSALHEYKGE